MGSLPFRSARLRTPPAAGAAGVAPTSAPTTRAAHTAACAAATGLSRATRTATARHRRPSRRRRRRRRRRRALRTTVLRVLVWLGRLALAPTCPQSRLVLLPWQRVASMPRNGGGAPDPLHRNPAGAPPMGPRRLQNTTNYTGYREDTPRRRVGHTITQCITLRRTTM